jgi:hypothetical protein
MSIEFITKRFLPTQEEETRAREILAKERALHEAMKRIYLFPGTLEEYAKKTGQPYRNLGEVAGRVLFIHWQQLGKELAPERLREICLGPYKLQIFQPKTFIIHEVKEQAVLKGADAIVGYWSNGRVLGFREGGIAVKTLTDPNS